MVPPVEPKDSESTLSSLRAAFNKLRVEDAPTEMALIAEGVAKPPRNASTLPEPVTLKLPVVEACPRILSRPPVTDVEPV